MVARTEKKNPYETQAKLSLLLAVIGGLSALMLVFCVFFRYFSFEEWAARYVEGSPRFYVIIGCAVLGMAAGWTGFFVGLNSAGRRRNPLSSLAWTAFFLNAAVALVSMCTFVVFWFAKDPVYQPTP
jgi:hypothetical protein